MLRTEQIGDSYVLSYRYDTDGKLVAVSSYNISTEAVNILYAQTNTRGDVVALYDGNGDIRTIYTYDSWGKLISVTDGEGNALGANKLGSLNSIRYRGYIYDSETGLYYLQSRYYDPEVGRFLNADSVDYIGYSDSVISYNVFAYCENNTVNKGDFYGFNTFDKIIKLFKKMKSYIDIIVHIEELKKFAINSSSYSDSINKFNNISRYVNYRKDSGLIELLTIAESKNYFIYSTKIEIYTYSAKVSDWKNMIKKYQNIEGALENIELLSEIVEIFDEEVALFLGASMANSLAAILKNRTVITCASAIGVSIILLLFFFFNGVEELEDAIADSKKAGDEYYYFNFLILSRTMNFGKVYSSVLYSYNSFAYYLGVMNSVY